MFRKESFPLVFGLIFSLALSLLMSAVVLLGRGMLSFPSLVTSFLPSFAISFLMTSFLPMMEIARAFASLFSRNEDSIAYYALSLMPSAILMSSLMSLAGMKLAMGEHFAFAAYLAALPKNVMTAYIVQLLTFRPLMALARKLCSR